MSLTRVQDAGIAPSPLRGCSLGSARNRVVDDRRLVMVVVEDVSRGTRASKSRSRTVVRDCPEADGPEMAMQVCLEAAGPGLAMQDSLEAGGPALVVQDGGPRLPQGRCSSFGFHDGPSPPTTPN